MTKELFNQRTALVIDQIRGEIYGGKVDFYTQALLHIMCAWDDDTEYSMSEWSSMYNFPTTKLFAALWKIKLRGIFEIEISLSKKKALVEDRFKFRIVDRK